jgi:hypothetical protein
MARSPNHTTAISDDDFQYISKKYLTRVLTSNNYLLQWYSQLVNIGVAEMYRKGAKLRICLVWYSEHYSHKLKRKLSSNLVKIGVARAILCHTLATPLFAEQSFIIIHCFSRVIIAQYYAPTSEVE